MRPSIWLCSSGSEFAEQAVHRDDRRRGFARIIDPDLAVRPGWNLERADLERGHSRIAGVELAAGAGAPDDEPGSALRDPQRLDRQRRIEVLAVAGDERDLAHHAILGRRKAEHADARRRLVEDGEVANAAFVGRQIGRWIVAAEGEAGLGQGRRRGHPRRQHEPGDHRRPGEARGENPVVVELGGRSRIGDLKSLPFELSDRERRRGAVRLGKHDVEPDRRGAVRREPIDDFRQHRPRPRPLAELPDAFVVYVDDRNRAFRCRPRPQLLISVEDEVIQPVERAEGGVGGGDDELRWTAARPTISPGSGGAAQNTTVWSGTPAFNAPSCGGYSRVARAEWQERSGSPICTPCSTRELLRRHAPFPVWPLSFDCSLRSRSG